MAEEFKDTLRRLIKKKGITQEKLANDLGVPESTIRRYASMHGTPKRERLEMIADYFNVSVDYLIGRVLEAPRQELSVDEKEDIEKRYIEKFEILTELEHRAKEMGLSLDDPMFQQIVMHAFELAVLARQKNQ